MVTSEARPFAKTGGLGDVSNALSRALARLGHQVTIVLPRYRGVDSDGVSVREIDVPMGAGSYPVRLIERPVDDGVNAILVDAPALFDRDGLYGDHTGEYGDNAFRFGLLGRAALEYARLPARGGRHPSVVHAHDWQGAFASIYLRTVLRDDPFFRDTRSVLTIHNLAFQGQFDSKELPFIGLSRDLYHPGLLEFWGRASSLKGAVVLSDTITTVSPTYAREIVTPEYGFGFNGILQDRAADLVGILNGIDVDMWDPTVDRYLPVHFNTKTLDQKSVVKHALLEYVNMPRDGSAMARPVVGIVSRLTKQKGCDLLADAADRMMALDATWVMLGSGDGWCEDMWRTLASRYPHRVAAVIGFDEQLSHLIEGGSDLFLMPSWYEPCGLNQMYSQRYGTLPVVRATGGLVDSVIDAADFPKTGTGFKFSDYNPDGLMWGLHRAMETFRDAKQWRTLQKNAMKQDFSWDVSAREYVKVYRGQITDGIRQGTDDYGRQLRPDHQRRKARTR
jgi:starch synthase